MTVLNLFAKHVESLEIQVVFSVSSKRYVIILLPLLFLRLLFAWLTNPSQSHKSTFMPAPFTHIAYQLHFSINAQSAQETSRTKMPEVSASLRPLLHTVTETVPRSIFLAIQLNHELDYSSHMLDLLVRMAPNTKSTAFLNPLFFLVGSVHDSPHSFQSPVTPNHSMKETSSWCN